MSWCDRKKFSSQPQVCEREKWSENKICRLVCLYKKFPCLWKKDNPSYMDNSTRHSAYSNIYQGMDTPQVTFTEVMIKIREVRRIYVDELQKILKAHSSGHRYEPKQKWFFTLHNFLYEHLDFDEAAELQSQNSATSCCQEYDDDEVDETAYSEIVEFDRPPRNDCKPSPNVESLKNKQCRKIRQGISCDSSEASSSMDDCSTPQRNPKRSPYLRVASSPPKTNRCPTRIVHCPRNESDGSSEVCQKSPCSKKSTSITIICEKKMDHPIRRDEVDNDAYWKPSGSVEKESSTLSCPRSSSIERLDSNGSLNTSPGKAYDEFDVFAKSVACQLRKMDIESAVMAQNQIQNVLTDQRLHKTQAIEPKTSETKNLAEVEEPASPQRSVTRVRSRVIKPRGSMFKRPVLTRKPVSQNSRKQEIRIVELPVRGVKAKQQISQNQTSLQRKTKKGSLK